jgi:hypothetical protein
LGAIFLHDERSWFVKLMGPADLVGKQQSAFDAFTDSTPSRSLTFISMSIEQDGQCIPPIL